MALNIHFAEKMVYSVVELKAQQKKKIEINKS